MARFLFTISHKVPPGYVYTKAVQTIIINLAILFNWEGSES